MDNFKALERTAQEVARKVSPSAREAAEEKAFAKQLINKLQPALPEARLLLVGSTARDTGLHGDKDIDVFALFPTRMHEEEIVKKTVAAVKKSVRARWLMHYAEHPYLQAEVGKYKVEVIPCFEAKPHAGIKSAVDRSPLHMDFLQKHLTQQQRQDVRALKQLLKTHGLYGAESSIKGFSGILCEYLVLNYRSFAGLIENARLWRPPVRISFVECEREFDAPLTLVDAVDVNRNVAAIVSATQLHRFMSLAQALWKNPSERFFFQKPKTKGLGEVRAKLRERGTSFFLVEMKKPSAVEDVFLPQLERTACSVEKQLALHDFHVVSSAFFVDDKKAFIFVELENRVLKKVKKVQGPPATHAAAVEQFVKRKKGVIRGPWVEDSRVVAEQSREVTDAKELLEKMRKSPVRFGVASRFIKPLRKARLHDKLPKLSPNAVEALAEHVFKKEAWF